MPSCLNPFQIRALVGTKISWKTTSLTTVLIPFKSGLWLEQYKPKRVSSVLTVLIPFKSGLWLEQQHGFDDSKRHYRLNPFQIRALVGTDDYVEETIDEELVLIPFKSGLWLERSGKWWIWRTPSCLNPFQIRALVGT